jgi:hypothetical protein
MHIDVVAGSIAAGQLGLITRGQGIAAGVTDNQIKKRTRSGKWRRVRTGVFAVAGAPASWEQTVLAAVLAAGEGSVASHLCAAALHEFPDSMRVLPEVTVRPGRNPKTSGLRVHRPRLLPDHDVTTIGGIPATSYARTLVDCTGRFSLGQIARALDAGLVRGKVTVWSVERSLSVLGQGPGRHPSKLWTLIGERGTEITKSESPPEIRMLRVLGAGGLPAPVQQHCCSSMVGLCSASRRRPPTQRSSKASVRLSDEGPQGNSIGQTEERGVRGWRVGGRGARGSRSGWRRRGR